MGVDTAPLRLVVEAQDHQMVAVRDLGPLQMLLPQMVLVGSQHRHLAVGSHHRLHKGDLQQRTGEHQLRHRGGQPLLIVGGKAAAGSDGLDTLLRQVLAHGDELVQHLLTGIGFNGVHIGALDAQHHHLEGVGVGVGAVAGQGLQLQLGGKDLPLLPAQDTDLWLLLHEYISFSPAHRAAGANSYTCIYKALQL